MKGRDLVELGFKPGQTLGVALKIIPEARRALGVRVLKDDLRAILKEPIGPMQLFGMALVFGGSRDWPASSWLMTSRAAGYKVARRSCGALSRFSRPCVKWSMVWRQPRIAAVRN